MTNYPLPGPPPTRGRGSTPPNLSFRRRPESRNPSYNRIHVGRKFLNAGVNQDIGINEHPAAPALRRIFPPDSGSTLRANSRRGVPASHVPNPACPGPLAVPSRLSPVGIPAFRPPGQHRRFANRRQSRPRREDVPGSRSFDWPTKPDYRRADLGNGKRRMDSTSRKEVRHSRPSSSERWANNGRYLPLDAVSRCRSSISVVTSIHSPSQTINCWLIVAKSGGVFRRRGNSAPSGCYNAGVTSFKPITTSATSLCKEQSL